MTEPSSFPLPAPLGGPPDLLVIAGEHSGDEHAARLVRGLLRLRPGLRVAALGGPRLAAAGAQLLFDRTAMSVVGLAEVVRNLSFFRALIRETVDWVAKNRPRAVCFVDNSGVNLRIAKELRLRGISIKGGGSVRALYYISPQIWASRAVRRFDMARNLDALAVIFPFEVGAYGDTSLPVEFVGHPFLAPDYAPPVRYDPNGPLLLLPGSRPRAVDLIFPVIRDGFYEYSQTNPGAQGVVLCPSNSIASFLVKMGVPERVSLRRAGAETVGASAVLTTSGTMSMHCSLAGIPGAIVYKTDPLTYLVGKFLVRVPYLGIANILLGQPMYPEFIQSEASPEALAGQITECLGNPARQGRTAAQAAELRALLANPPGVNEADWLLRQLS
ncbi:MAG TPA: lipid-A-disaccharide synthase [Opitutaceae bacterium]